MTTAKPNVLFIMTDQQRWDTLGCYGNDVIETTNLDYLASLGTVFDHAYTPSPSCVPARASLMTGMDPWTTGILGMGQGQKPMGVNFDHTLPGELSEAGYHTQGVGKMHFSPQRALNGFHNTVLDESGRVHDPGFVSDYQQWFEKNKTGDYGMVEHGMGWNDWQARPYHAPAFLHPTNWTVNESIRFLNERDPSKPFFLKTSFARPHSPYDAPEYYFNLYNEKDLPKQVVGEWAAMHDVPEDAVKPDAWRGVQTDEHINRARAGYYGNIHLIDHQIGRLITCLKQNGLFNNTFIIFTSDHGDMLGDHNLWRKTYAYEGSSHIPLIIKQANHVNQRSTSRVDTPVLLQDIMPTILDAVKVDIPETVDGVSLLPLMENGTIERSYIHGEHSTCYSEEQEMQYVTDGKMKYIWFPRIDSEQLFDLTKDPYERENLTQNPNYQDGLKRWRKRMVDQLKPRDAGLTDGENLVSQAGKPFHVSPNYDQRMKDVELFIK